MNIDSVRVFVNDLAEANHFYEQILGLECVADGTDEGYMVYRPGEINLIVETVDKDSEEERDLVGRFTGISIHEHDVETMCRQLKKIDDKCVVDDPSEQNWGGVMAHIMDPSGNIITLVEY